VFWKTTGRILIVIPFALLLAAAASGFVLVTLGLEHVTSYLHVNPIGDEDVETVFAMMNQGLMLAASITLIPALLMVIVGEVASIRSVAYWRAMARVAPSPRRTRWYGRCSPPQGLRAASSTG
jgi:hypothetical protein